MAKPKPLSQSVSQQMSRMPRASTKPEVALRRRLHALGLRYRVNVKDLPGRPDVVLTRARIAIFVDGCFWHACPDHGVLPKNNRAWWAEKLRLNVSRDRLKDQELEANGWAVLHFWEHEDPVDAAERVVRLWRERRHGDVGSE